MKNVFRLLLVPAVLLSLIQSVPPPTQAQERSPDPNHAVGLGHHTDPQDACDRVNICSNLPMINGEAYAGNNEIWQTDFTAGVLIKRNLTTCQVTARCVIPGLISPSELTMWQGKLVLYDFGTGLLYFIDPGTCQVLWTCDAPGDNLAEGLASDGDFLYKGDSSMVYKFTSSPNGGCVVVSTCPNPPGDSFDGLDVCQGNLVGLGYSGMLYLVNPNCGIVGACPLNAGASGNGIASDGTGRVFVDDIDALTLDDVNVGCDIPVPVQSTTWSKIKAARYN